MRAVRKLPAESILKQFCPMKGTWRTPVPKKHENEGLGGGCCMMNEKAEPLVAFNKPRPPPVLVPLVVLSFLETLSSDGDD